MLVTAKRGLFINKITGVADVCIICWCVYNIYSPQKKVLENSISFVYIMSRVYTGSMYIERGVILLYIKVTYPETIF